MHYLQKEEYPLLHLFKHKMALEKTAPSHKIYTFHKSSVFLYRCLFIAIGTLYLVIAALIFHKTLSWSCEFIFGSNLLIKSLLLGLCSLIALFCLGIGFFMSTEKEAAKKVIKKGKEKLNRIYERKQIQYGLTSFFNLFSENRHAQAFRQQYQETLAIFNEIQEEAFHLLRRISITPELSSNSREELFNQALLELKQRTEKVVLLFESSYPVELVKK